MLVMIQRYIFLGFSVKSQIHSESESDQLDLSRSFNLNSYQTKRPSQKLATYE